MKIDNFGYFSGKKGFFRLTRRTICGILKTLRESFSAGRDVDDRVGRARRQTLGKIAKGGQTTTFSLNR